MPGIVLQRPDNGAMTVSAPELVLASASPRRADLLRAAGIRFAVRPAHVDEMPLAGEPPVPYVRRLAEAKAAAVSDDESRVILAADTIVVADDLILGKPSSPAEARQMLQRLAARTHEVITGVCLRHRVAGRPLSAIEVERTVVEFAPMSDAELDWYVATGEPLDKAGAYAVQGLASRFVTRIEGSFSNVVGLPVALVYRMCTAAGILIS